MLTVKGIYKNGRVTLNEILPMKSSKVIVIFPDDEIKKDRKQLSLEKKEELFVFTLDTYGTEAGLLRFFVLIRNICLFQITHILKKNGRRQLHLCKACKYRKGGVMSWHAWRREPFPGTGSG